ncbi:hypothetical protein D3C87_1782410 [compost metagenome]
MTIWRKSLSSIVVSMGPYSIFRVSPCRIAILTMVKSYSFLTAINPCGGSRFRAFAELVGRRVFWDVAGRLDGDQTARSRRGYCQRLIPLSEGEDHER